MQCGLDADLMSEVSCKRERERERGDQMFIWDLTGSRGCRYAKSRNGRGQGAGVVM